MAKPAQKSSAEQVIDDMLDEPAEVTIKPVKREPLYRMIGDSKIPVSKATGKLWKARRDQSKALIENLQIAKAWDEAIAYYKNDQSTPGNRDRDPNKETRSSARGFSRIHSETENIVFANVSALVPSVYAKNPDVEITAEPKRELEKFATVCERLVNTLFAMKVAPGVNLKPKAKRAVVMTTLTNISFFETGYVKKSDSSDQALEDLQLLSNELLKAEDAKEIMEIEGRIAALEMNVHLLAPAGPYVKFRDPRDILGDPNTTLGDFSDSSYFMIKDYAPTEILKALYGKPGKDGSTVSVFAPTHILKTKTDGVEEETMFSPFHKEGSHRDYGYEDENTFKFSQRTRVWYVWDLVTRRVYLFNDDDWAWPLWVWDDPYQYENFFPLTPAAFYTDPEGPYARSEVMYYLDQQDEMNKINSQIKRAREFVTGKFLYNKKEIKGEGIEAFLRGDSELRVLGVDASPETDLSKVLHGVELPILKFPELLDKGPLLEAINRISSIGLVMRNQEFKTNTTNKAIENYESSNQTRLDEKIDAVEDAIGDVGWKILQLCIRFMSAEEVAKLIGQENAAIWSQFAQPENLQYLTLKIVGGSALKPTARAKKEEAVQVGQILGQFANASPAAVLVLLRVMQRAFDEIDITEEDWQLIIDSITSQMNKGRTDGAGGGEGGGEGGPSVEQVIQQLDQIIGGLPPEVRKQLGEAIARGATPSQIVEQISGGSQPTQG